MNARQRKEFEKEYLTRKEAKRQFGKKHKTSWSTFEYLVLLIALIAGLGILIPLVYSLKDDEIKFDAPGTEVKTSLISQESHFLHQ